MRSCPTKSTYFFISALLALCLSPAAVANAQLPFYTDDADTTDKGKFHVEFFNEHDILAREVYPAKRQNTANFTLNYGVTKRLEFDINAPMLMIFHTSDSGVGTPKGIGDMQFGLKYRFHDEREGSRLPAVAVVFYFEAPTGSTSKQLGSGIPDYYLYGIVQKSLTSRTRARLNGGIVFAGNTSTGLVGIESTRGHVLTLSGSLTRDFTKKLNLGAELFGGVASNLQLSRGQLEGQIGGTYALNEQLTLAFGVLGGRFAASPRLGVLLGIAYDFK